MARTQPNTQRGDVLNHLKTFGSITSWEAIQQILFNQAKNKIYRFY